MSEIMREIIVRTLVSVVFVPSFHILVIRRPSCPCQKPEVALVSTTATANPVASTSTSDDSLPPDYERVKVFHQAPGILAQDLNNWLKQMQKNGYRLEITGRLQSGGDDNSKVVTVTIFYKYHYK